jgi:hypothetical protein
MQQHRIMEFTLHYNTLERTGMRSPQRWLAYAVHSAIQQWEKVAFLSPNEKYGMDRLEREFVTSNDKSRIVAYRYIIEGIP